VCFEKLIAVSFAPANPSARTYTGTPQSGPNVESLLTENDWAIRSSTPAAVVTVAFFPTCKLQTLYTPACNFVVVSSSSVTAPYVPGASVAEPCLPKVNGFAALHENDGNEGALDNSGSVKPVGPEFCGATFDPGVRWFA
jgi:hypothetical protein